MLNLETFAYDAAEICSAVMVASFLMVVLTFTSRGTGKWGKYLKFLTIAAGIISIEILLFLIMYKEAFHWNYDIATGEPVDHYSTYGSCMVMGVISLVSNALALVIQLRKRNKEEHNEKRHL